MKLLIALIILLSIAGCASRVVVKDCIHLGQEIYDCEEL